MTEILLPGHRGLAGPHVRTGEGGASHAGQTAGDPGKPFPGPRASVCTAPGAGQMGAIQRPFLQPSDSPGPRYLYVDTTMRATPSCSLGSRNAIPPPPARSPGPCYNPSAALIGNVTQPRAVRSHPPHPRPLPFSLDRDMNCDHLSACMPRHTA
eukprot:COSAG01_NODE_33_length_35013_cov_86.824144_31_plen_154_part_00